MASVFFSYSHKDEDLRDQLETMLSTLKRQGVIETWHDRRIGAGEEFAAAIDGHVNTDNIILLLVSPDFIASHYCYEIEMTRAMERHLAGDAIVIPVILRICDWHSTPFGKLNATPPDGRPITQYPDRDQAMFEVAKAVRAAVARLPGRGSSASTNRPSALPTTAAGSGSMTQRSFSTPQASSMATSAAAAVSPRSSNLALAKTFSERERDAFKRDTFEYVARFFENSLAELAARNPGVEGDYQRIDANRFTAAVYVGGTAASRCTVFVGDGHFAGGIAFSHGVTSGSNSFNELLTVDADDQSMCLRGMGMTVLIGRGGEKLTQEGAAEAYWGSFIQPLQARG